MAFNIISKGILFNFILNTIVIFALIKYGFEIENQTFSILLILMLFLVSIYIGWTSKRTSEHPQINGFFTGLGSSLIILLFISQFADLNLATNIAISVVWMFIGYLGGFVGSKMSRDNSVSKKEIA